MRDLAELVRLPAGLTVPGDTMAGAAAAGRPRRRRAWALPVASVSLYWAGMALNDYADRELDRVERPERPLPSGRVSARQALALATGLTATGVTVAAVAGGRPALRVALPLATVVWSYDLALKDTRLGPPAMAAARGLDVLLGAASDTRRATLPAVALAAHTLGVTALSRGEVHGATRASAGAVVAGTVATATAVACAEDDRSLAPRVARTLLAAVYAATVGRAQAAAFSSPDGATVRAATGAGIRGMIPLQAALAARSGALGAAAGILVAGPVARVASKVVSPT